MATYQDYVNQGMSPNQAALQVQLGPRAQPQGLPMAGNQPVSPQVAQRMGIPMPQGSSLPSPSSPKYALEGFDAGKLSSGHDSPKYQVGRVLSGFDPSQGLSPEVLAELNKLGLGTFSSDNGQRLTVGGNVDPRFGGITSFDVVRNFTGPGDKAWQWGVEDGRGASAPARVGAADQYSALSSLLSGDPYQRIQEAIQAVNRDGSVNIDALMRQLQEG